jgi:hypothetical protein
MTQQEIQEGNKQIALMLGWNGDAFLLEKNIKAKTGLCHLKFHLDWNWIMEAVEFICGTLGYRKYSYTHEEHSRCVFTDMAILFQKHDFGGGNIIIDSDEQKTEKEAMFIAVSDFAKLYNEEKL